MKKRVGDYRSQEGEAERRFLKVVAIFGSLRMAKTG